MLTIPLITVGQLLASASHFSNQPLAVSRVTKKLPTAMGPFTIGLRWNRTADGIAVEDVLRTSPADLAGIEPGDLVVAVNDSRDLRDVEARLTELTQANYRAKASITVARGPKERVLTVVAAGMSQIVRRLSGSTEKDKTKVASVTLQ